MAQLSSFILCSSLALILIILIDPIISVSPPDSKVANNSTEMKPCKSREFVQRGYCQFYISCSRKTNFEVKRACSEGLYWNPKVNSIHGGICDYYRNVDKDILLEYKKDPNCLMDVAYFRSVGECSAEYFYHHPKKTGRKEIKQECPTGLLWSKRKESCAICTAVLKNDGVTPCCKNTDYDDDY